MAGCWYRIRSLRNYPQSCLSQLHERHSMHLPQSVSITSEGCTDVSCGPKGMSVTHTNKRGTGLPLEHSLLLQHRNATVHNNESEASVAADARTNVPATTAAQHTVSKTQNKNKNNQTRPGGDY